MRSTRVSQAVNAPRKAVYEACIDPDALVSWRVPDTMTARVLEFDAREGAAFRFSLTYQTSQDGPGGKTSKDTDTFHGRFMTLEPYQKIVEVVEFESNDPDLRGDMTVTTLFADLAAGTEVTILCENIPPGIRLEDNETGTRQSLRKLAALMQERH